jgi:pilus assembly protein TadC
LDVIYTFVILVVNRTKHGCSSLCLVVKLVLSLFFIWSPLDGTYLELLSNFRNILIALSFLSNLRLDRPRKNRIQ